MDKDTDKYAKLEISMRYWLLGKGWLTALKAMEFARAYHTGVRKDGFTPEFQHQLEIAHFIRTLASGLENPEQVLTLAFLHDVAEDYGVSQEELEPLFGQAVSTGVLILSKKFRGESKDTDAYFEDIGNNINTSIVKGADRIHNLQSMLGVFTREKQTIYMAEVRYHFLPMLKKARRLFPQQEMAYENIKHMLTSQLELYEAIHRQPQGV